MSYPAIKEYLNALAKHYFGSNKNKKTDLLNHASQITGLHRKSLIRWLGKNEPIQNNKKNCGVKPKYPEELLLIHINCLWKVMGKISAKRMKEAIPLWPPDYHINGVDNHIKYLLQKMITAM
jgi:hypothetical protein